ncbi:MAG TPA: PIN domain-containing protein [Saprospiraceae bacterium]|nr:PIN domain-containing protein [Saprospiraceae bacterium]HRK82301.1 PIN domain-containing protein [Saprospiraceae bacterium]
MKIIIDTNILISTLMNLDSRIGTFLLKELNEHEKLSCYMLYVELFDKKEKIIRYSKIPESELLELLYLVLKKIQFINEYQISQVSWNKALELTEGIDVKDVSFVALTIESNGILWTGDKKLHTGLKAKGFTSVCLLEELQEKLNK